VLERVVAVPVEGVEPQVGGDEERSEPLRLADMDRLMVQQRGGRFVTATQHDLADRVRTGADQAERRA
jgi:hypothetical protein